MTPDQIKLAQLVKRLSYREGDFTLASGQKSSFYIDVKTATLHPECAKIIGKVAVQVLTQNQVRVEGVGGLTLGADPIGTAVSLAAFDQGLHWPAFIVRKEIKGHGTLKWIEGEQNLKPGASLVVLEDVVTTGGSSAFALEKLKDAGFKVEAILTIVDREQGGRAALESKGIRLFSMLTLNDVRNALPAVAET